MPSLLPYVLWGRSQVSLFFASVVSPDLHHNLVTSPVKAFRKFQSWPPGAFRCLFWHWRTVSHQVQISFDIYIYYLHLVRRNPSMPKYTSGGQTWNFHNTFDSACDEIRMKIQTENFFRILIWWRLMVTIFVSNGRLSCLSRFINYAFTFPIKTLCVCWAISELNMTTMLSFIVCQYFVFLLPNDWH